MGTFLIISPDKCNTAGLSLIMRNVPIILNKTRGSAKVSLISV
jgi:hypothetical protein